MIADGIKSAAKGTFNSSLLAVVGAAVVYFLIKGWQKARAKLS